MNLKRISQQLEQLQETFDSISDNQEKLMALLDALTAQVAQDTTVIQSAITLINGLASQISAAGTDPAKLNAIVTQLKANDDALAAAIAANTPAAPTAWVASTAYALGAVITTPDGHTYSATTAGTSGATAPTFPTTVGVTVTDGTVVWTCAT